MPGPRRASCVLSAAPGLPLAPAKAADIPFAEMGGFAPPPHVSKPRSYHDWRCGALLSQFVNQPHNSLRWLVTRSQPLLLSGTPAQRAHSRAGARYSGGCHPQRPHCSRGLR